MSEAPPIRLNRLLVATDGAPASDSVFVVAKLLAERHTATAEIVAVYSPDVPAPPRKCQTRTRLLDVPNERAADELFQRVCRQARRVAVPWPIHMRAGHAPWVIADVACYAGADLVVLGHSTLSDGDRANTRHTAEQIALCCDVPVLAVSPGVTSLFRLAVAVLDDSEASKRVPSLVAALLAPGGSMRVRTGVVTREVLQMASAEGADLVALPLGGDTHEVRSLMLGGVAAVLLHAPCSVLIAESGTEPQEIAAGPAGEPATESVSVAE